MKSTPKLLLDICINLHMCIYYLIKDRIFNGLLPNKNKLEKEFSNEIRRKDSENLYCLFF